MNLSVNEVLEIDLKNRQLNGDSEDNDIFYLKDFENEKNDSWDYSFPTIVKDSEFHMSSESNSSSRKSNLCNTEIFIERLKKENPLIHKLSETSTMDNVLIAGGFVSELLTKSQRYKYDDIDMFIYGLNEESANTKVEQIIQKLFNLYCEELIEIDNKLMQKKIDAYKKDNKGTEKEIENEIATIVKSFKEKQYNPIFSMFRSPGAIKINLNRKQYQIIFRLYGSVDQILHGFDLGSSAVGFNSNGICFTTLSRFCYTYNCNIVDPSHRSPSYESRLVKYFNRGFAIILPELDMSKLRTKYFKYRISEVCELPHLVFSYSKIYGNAILLNELIHYNKSKSDYGDDFNLNDLYTLTYQLKYLNTLNLVNGTRTHLNLLNLYNFMSNDNDCDDHNDKIFNCTKENYNVISTKVTTKLLSTQPYISREGLIRVYRKYQRDLIRDFHQKIPTKLLYMYFPEENLGQLCTNLATFDRTEYETLVNTLVEKYIARSTKLFDEEIKNKNYEHIDWLVNNPGTQILSGSFNPIIETVEKWYGDLLSV
jgi:hypothetical protein